MSRKRSIIILVLLLIIAGGAGFYLHLRKLPPTGSSDLFHILFSSPTVVGWHVEEIHPYRSWTYEKEGWWSFFGYRRRVIRDEHRYRFTHPKMFGPSVMKVETEGEKVIGLSISGDGQFEEDFFDQYRQYQQFHYLSFH